MDPSTPQGGPAYDAATAARIIEQLEKAIEDRDDTIAEIKNDNSEMRDHWAQMRFEYESKIEGLQAELGSLRLQQNELTARYDDAKEQLHELHGNEQEIENARKERHDAILQLQRMEQENLSMTEELGMLHNENEQLRANLNDAQSNLSKLQTTLVSMKKEKREYEAKFSKYIQDSQAREEALHIEIEDLEARLEEVNRASEALRQGMLESEQEKMKMQNDFTAATMDLLADDLNSHNKHMDSQQSTMRLSQITSEDVHKTPVKARSDSQYSVISDGVVDEFQQHGMQDSVQFVSSSHRMASGSIAVNDESLLDEMKQRYHNRTDSQLSVDSEAGHKPRHSRQLSIGAASDAVLQKLRVFLSRELIGQVKTMLGEELKHIDIKEQFDGLPEKLEGLLNQIIENQGEMKSKGSSLDEESLNKILNQFQATVTESLKETLGKMNESNSNVEDIKQALNTTLDDIGGKLESFGSSDALKSTFSDTMTMQMTALQVSMENQIEHSIKNSIKQSMSDNVSKNVENVVNTQIGQPLETIHETVEKIYQMQVEIAENGVKKRGGSGTDSGSESDASESGGNSKSKNKKYNKIIDELGAKMDAFFNDNSKFEESMQDRIDKFMESFRKEVIPEFQAMFEVSGKSSNGARGGNGVDDEKYDENRNSYELKIESLENKIVTLEEDSKVLKQELKDAATSKAGSLLRLQNLIDHLRFDNRVLQQKLDAFQLGDAIYYENERMQSQNRGKSSWMGNIVGGFMNTLSNVGGGGGNSQPRVIHVNVSNMPNVTDNRDNRDNRDNIDNRVHRNTSVRRDNNNNNNMRNARNMPNIADISNIDYNAAAEYTANAAVNVMARAVAAGVNGQNVST